ncbi:TPA: Lrp/AsnC family transcriptional regulator [Citrobacter freundii]|nr:Lrp/AsnC family transcriptional regulator [Citrobacter freundii]HEE9922582.1 Lrp/AsnC family transcriptional regulator [Citrobacter freundii]
MSKPTDEEIIQVLRDHGNCMTYVVTHWLRDKYKVTKTAYVLRRLKKLEALGVVKRVKSSYAVQICWEASK